MVLAGAVCGADGEPYDAMGDCTTYMAIDAIACAIGRLRERSRDRILERGGRR